MMQTVESVIANSSLPLEKRLTFAENVFFAPRMEIHWKENSVLECLSSLLLRPSEPSQLSAIGNLLLKCLSSQRLQGLSRTGCLLPCTPCMVKVGKVFDQIDIC